MSAQAADADWEYGPLARTTATLRGRRYTKPALTLVTPLCCPALPKVSGNRYGSYHREIQARLSRPLKLTLNSTKFNGGLNRKPLFMRRPDSDFLRLQSLIHAQNVSPGLPLGNRRPKQVRWMQCCDHWYFQIPEFERLPTAADFQNSFISPQDLL